MRQEDIAHQHLTITRRRGIFEQPLGMMDLDRPILASTSTLSNGQQREGKRRKKE